MNLLRCALLPLLLAASSACAAEEDGSGWRDATGDLGQGEAAGAGVWRLAAWPGPGLVVAALHKRGLWATADGGATWTRLGEAGRRPSDAGIGVQFLVDPAEPQRMWFSGMYGFGCWRSDDGGKSFVQLGANSHLDGLGIDFSDPQRQTLVEGLHEQSRSLHRSTDGGRTWTAIGDRLPAGTGFSNLPIVLDGQTFLSNTSGWGKSEWGIWRSTDAGETWSKVSPAGPADCALVTAAGHIFWPLLWNGDHLASRDGGLTWEAMPAPVRGQLCELPGGILVGFGGGKRAQPFASSDDGRTWKPFGDEAPFTPVGVIYDGTRNALLCWRGGAAPLPFRVARWDLPDRPAAVIANGAGGRLTVWDGEGNNGGAGWTGAGAGSSFRPQRAVAKTGRTALEFRVASATAATGGWNWHNWAMGALTDITACTHLQIWLKFAGADRPATVAAELNCGPDKISSAAVDLLALEPALLDGEWHLLEVPLAALLADAPRFEPRNTYELRLLATAPKPIGYSLYLDTIRFVSRPLQKSSDLLP